MLTYRVQGLTKVKGKNSDKIGITIKPATLTMYVDI